MGLVWLEKVFQRFIKPIREIIKCLLILDSYSSYINIAFVNYTNRYGIIILVLPPYITY